MTTNLTIDDSSPDIIYSSDWATQSSIDDPKKNEFFQSTYHSAQGDGASANLTFTDAFHIDEEYDAGSAIYLYGSKGPGHANYSVQFDNFIIFYSANQSETDYQQLLFGQTFNKSGTHFVSLTSHQVSSTNNWADLDYITITVNETDSNSTAPSTSQSASTPTASPTISPPWLLEASSTGVAGGLTSSMSTTSPTASSSALSSSTNHVTLVLAAVFGGLILAALIFGTGFFIARRGNRHNDQMQSELRPETPGTGTRAGAFTYKPPPSPPSFFGGQTSPESSDFLQSPASRTDPFRDRLSPGPEHGKHGTGQAPGVILDGRRSPHSTLSMGGATVLTAASTAQLLNPHLHKVTGAPMTHKQSDSVPITGKNTGQTQSPLQQHRITSDQLPIYKQHRVYGSETAINAIKGAAAAGVGVAAAEPTVVVLANASTPPPTEKPENLTANMQVQSDSRQERPVPLMALHATHRSEFDPSTNSRAAATAAPQRPKRPGDGLLDFLGNQLAQRLERSATAKRRRDDADSERTNFLKV